MMTDEMFLNYILPLVFLLTGLIFLISAVRNTKKTRIFLAKAHQTTGEVIALETVPSSQPGADQLETYRPVVAFTDDVGRTVRFESRSSSYPAKYSVGENLQVLYLPNQQSEARIYTFSDLWFLTGLFGGLGLVFTLLGGGLLICTLAT